MTHESERRDLQRLGEFDRWMVVNYWRFLLWKQRLRRVPSPIRQGLIVFVVTSLMELFFPVTRKSPIIDIFIMWVSSFTISTAICLALPLKQRTAHWVKRYVH